MDTNRHAGGNDSPVEIDGGCLQVLEGLLAGDRAAVAQVYERFARPLAARAERLIPARHRRKVVTESVVHSVMEGLLDLDPAARARMTRYAIRNWGQLYGLLARITIRKCLNRLRRFGTRKRSSDRELPLDAAFLQGTGPTAEDEAAFAE